MHQLTLLRNSNRFSVACPECRWGCHTALVRFIRAATLSSMLALLFCFCSCEAGRCMLRVASSDLDKTFRWGSHKKHRSLDWCGYSGLPHSVHKLPQQMFLLERIQFGLSFQLGSRKRGRVVHHQGAEARPVAPGMGKPVGCPVHSAPLVRSEFV